MEAILPPGRPFYPLPEGHFWYRDIDPTYGWLPTPDAGAPPEQWRSALVPRGRIEAARFVRVITGEAGVERRTWQGDWLVAYRRPAGFTEEDWTACLEFFGSSAAIAFLDRVKRRCELQANALNHLPLPKIDFDPALGSESSMTARLARAAVAVERLDELHVLSRSMGDEEAAADICERIAHIELVADEALECPGSHQGVAHRVLAACAASLDLPLDAARHGCEVMRRFPEDHVFGTRLAIRLRRAGHPEEARVISRRSVETKVLDAGC